MRCRCGCGCNVRVGVEFLSFCSTCLFGFAGEFGVAARYSLTIVILVTSSLHDRVLTPHRHTSSSPYRSIVTIPEG
ncbi:uncharacterized protein BDV14DRAFT_161630 [Aspergillus stella-maris]|uniref:uncharacterized protein n=1 Tax=Aspergillus stella-maris TaxID=1810926 RepID=UPI003CCDF4FD